MRLIMVMLWIGAMAAIVLALVFVSSPPIGEAGQAAEGYSLVRTPHPPEFGLFKLSLR